MIRAMLKEILEALFAKDVHLETIIKVGKAPIMWCNNISAVPLTRIKSQQHSLVCALGPNSPFNLYVKIYYWCECVYVCCMGFLSGRYMSITLLTTQTATQPQQQPPSSCLRPSSRKHSHPGTKQLTKLTVKLWYYKAELLDWGVATRQRGLLGRQKHKKTICT